VTGWDDVPGPCVRGGCDGTPGRVIGCAGGAPGRVGWPDGGGAGGGAPVRGPGNRGLMIG